MEMFHCDVITIGTATVDIFIQSRASQVITSRDHRAHLGFSGGQAQCFPLGSKIEIDAPYITIGGGAYNAGVTFSRAGLRTGIATKLGADLGGSIVHQGIDIHHMQSLITVDPKEKTAMSFNIIAPNGERTVLVHRGSIGKLSARDISLSSVASSWAYIAPGNMPLKTLASICATLHTKGIHIACNPSRDMLSYGLNKLRPLLNKMQVVIMNREEAAYLTGYANTEKEKIFKKLDADIAGIAVMTDGPRGAYVSDGTTLFEAGIFKEKKVVDRTGAGDAFGSGFVAGLIETKEHCRKGVCGLENIAYALRRAAANSTSVIESVGATEGIMNTTAFTSQARWKKLSIKTYTL